MIASGLVSFFCPMAAGSGIPEIKCVLNGVRMKKVTRMWTLICKAFGVTLSVAGGLPVGKEGPMVHSGAVIGNGLGTMSSDTLKCYPRLKSFEHFKNDSSRAGFIAAGAAAGVAAAFGAPVGGVLFALEEGVSHWNLSLTWRTFAAAIMGTTSVNLFISFFYWGQQVRIAQ